MLNKITVNLSYFWAETLKSLITTKRYLLNFIADIVLMVIFMGVIFIGARTVNIDKFEAGMKVVNFAVYFIALFGLQQMVNMVKEENEIGTMEQLFLLPAGFLKIFFLRSVIHITQQIIIFFGLAMLFTYLTNTELVLPWFEVALIGFLVWLGLSGVGLILGGIALIFKQIGQVVSLITLLLFPVSMINFTGTIPMQELVKYFPLTLGLKVIQSMGYGVVGLCSPAIWTDFLYLVLCTLGYFVVGLVIFLYCLSTARSIGVLGKY